MSKIKQAIELLTREAAALEPSARQTIERLVNEARLLIQPVSHPIDKLADTLTKMRQEALAGVERGLEYAKDETEEVLESLAQFFEQQGMEVKLQTFEREAGETEEEFHLRVQRKIEEFENSAFADDEGNVDLSILTREELTAYINELDNMLVEAGDIIEQQTSVVQAQTEKIEIQSKLLDEANRNASEVHGAASKALNAIHDFDIKHARELLERVIQ